MDDFDLTGLAALRAEGWHLWTLHETVGPGPRWSAVLWSKKADSQRQWGEGSGFCTPTGYGDTAMEAIQAAVAGHREGNSAGIRKGKAKELADALERAVRARGL